MKSESSGTSIFDKIILIFRKFENIITIGLSTIIGMIILLSFYRVLQQVYNLFYHDLMNSQPISFNDYQILFGRIMTLLISLEFLNSILKVLKTHEVRLIISDVILITALAIARKLIIYDYDNHDPLHTIVLGGILLSIGIFYYLIKQGTK